MASELDAGQSGPAGSRELLTPAWSFWLWAATAPTEAHMLYITATSESLLQIGPLIIPLIGAPVRPAAVRLVRSPQVLDQMSQMPAWAGKAISFYLSAPAEILALARQADELLAGQGFDGPPVLGARPYGGRSGLIFLRSSAAADQLAVADPRQGRLSALLGGTDS